MAIKIMNTLWGAILQPKSLASIILVFVLALIVLPQVFGQVSIADINGDGMVDIRDLGILLSHWGYASASVADLNSDTLVDVRDLGILLSHWGMGEQVSPSPTAAVTPAPSPTATPIADSECSNWGAGWIFCDDFELNRMSSYFEFDDDGGEFSRTNGVGVNNSTGMRVLFQTGETSAGNLKLAFGRTPNAYMASADRGTDDYREIYWRFYLRNQVGWNGGGGDKLTRAIVFADPSWAEAAVSHVWSGGQQNNRDYLIIDPTSGTDTAGNLQTIKYNDFANMRWLGGQMGSTPLFDAAHVGPWYCVEAHMRLNDPGQNNGMVEFWINDQLEAQRNGLNLLGNFNTYGINAIFLENYWNAGSPQRQERYLDNFVVSTERIGCGNGLPAPSPTPTSSPVPTQTSTPVPTGTPISKAPDFIEDFTGYASTNHMLSDPRGIYSRSSDVYDNTSVGGGMSNNGVGTITLDTTDGYGALGQSMKYTWFSYDSPGPGGTLGRWLEFSAAQDNEIWIETAFKFSSNFKVDHGYTGGVDYKWFFVPVIRGHGWSLTFEGGALSQFFEDFDGTGEHPSPYANYWNLRQLADDQWHVMRVHIRRSPPLYDVWIDGAQNRTALTSWAASYPMGSVILGQNINQRPVNTTQSLRYGYIKAWYAGNDPGW